jgi:hypothetical protein
VDQWARAWAGKQIAAYLGAYDRSFQPPRGLSRSAWEAERRSRIQIPADIDVEVSNLRITVQGDTARAVFRQRYSAGSFNASTTKTLEFVRRGERWLITRETTG